MTIKNILLASSAVAFMTAAPAMAQDTPPPAPAPAAAQAPSLTLTPGATVRGADGELGKLEGVQTNAEGKQELTVRGADGQVRGVPLAGIRQDGADVVVGFTKAEYDAAAPVAGAPAANPPAAEPAAPPAGETTEPTPPPAPSEPQS
nr:hypothetical protein [uncultured Brevundimonas sp.]